MRWHLIKQTSWMALFMLGMGLIPSCQSEQNTKPDNLIPGDRMADILTEVHKAETRVSRLGLRSVDSSNIAYKHLEKQIFKRFKVDTAAYARSYGYYSSHPREMEVIYKQVVEKLKKESEAPKSKPAKS